MSARLEERPLGQALGIFALFAASATCVAAISYDAMHWAPMTWWGCTIFGFAAVVFAAAVGVDVVLVVGLAGELVRRWRNARRRSIQRMDEEARAIAEYFAPREAYIVWDEQDGSAGRAA